jgi:Asp-tRNA(Asn)/Glu-tRNA(Gln) amidotransferase A subunit family amidase
VPDAWTAAHLDLQQAQAAAVHARRRAAGQRYAPDVEARLDRGAALPDDDVRRAREVRRAAAATVRRWLRAHDVLLAPCAPDVAPPREEADLAALRAGLLACVVPLTQHGGPVLAVPAGTHDGLPLGVQLSGPPGSDSLLLALAAAVAD